VCHRTESGTPVPQGAMVSASAVLLQTATEVVRLNEFTVVSKMYKTWESYAVYLADALLRFVN